MIEYFKKNNENKYIVTCHKCGHNWLCKSSRIYVTCASCRCNVRLKDPFITEVTPEEINTELNK